MTISNRVKITISPLRLHAASSLRIPTPPHSFRTLLPTVRIRPLNLFSASSVDLHSASNTNFLIHIRFGTKLYRQIVGIPMGTNCAPLVADLFLFCYERDFMKDLSSDNQADVFKAFNSTSRYLDDLLNIDNPYFEGMVHQIYPSEKQLNKANTSDTEAPFLD